MPQEVSKNIRDIWPSQYSSQILCQFSKSIVLYTTNVVLSRTSNQDGLTNEVDPFDGTKTKYEKVGNPKETDDTAGEEQRERDYVCEEVNSL